MTAHPRLAALVAVLVAVLALPGCGNKDEATPAAGGGGGGGLGVPDPPLSHPRAEGRAAQLQSKENLKKIGTAFHLHHDVNNALPAGFCDKSGKVILSWRVQILPHVEAADLFNQFHFDEPWDSFHNKALIEKMPKVFAPPGDRNTHGHTYYRAFTGQGTALQPQKRGPPPEKLDPSFGWPAVGMRITEITDGTSNTVVVAEATDSVIWTKPDELEYAADKPVPKIGGSVLDEGYHLLSADGSVRFFPKPLPEKVLRALITANGGETINPKDLD
jgi:hypothetical protein